MAKILGFEVKNVKSFKDHDGYPIYQGNVYFKGKKLGFWSQDGWGGPDSFEFDERPYNEAMKGMDLVETLNLSTPYGFTLDPDMDILMGELLKLKDTEKYFKKFAKQGCTKMASLEHGYEGMVVGMDDDDDVDTRIKEVVKKNGWVMKDVKVQMFDAKSFTVGEPLAIS